MREIALYHPYVHVRDDRWLKTAALYWPRLARVAPTGYPLTDSDTALILDDELGFIVTVSPDTAAQAVAPLFLELLRTQQDRLVAALGGALIRASIGYPADAPYSGQYQGHPRAATRLAAVHWEEMNAELREALFDAGLALEAARGRPAGPALRWIAMHPRLAWAYKCVLTEQVAEIGQFTPATDQQDAHLSPHGWTTERLLAALTSTGAEDTSPPGTTPPDPTHSVGLLAIRTVIPQWAVRDSLSGSAVA
ncbi:DUF6236 family protein [Streptomyces sp. LX-29]|uniref:DUF6236 family protein n=1 Tax=Streptomyces sp. LX-29 TaxID=2900152 RepID=UPI00240DF80A|nr:DUF6236 family protein [Streptomyces sp. LX-29]WFB11340.1 DUF6236 family protein [Streptomyces sp. LX-29]